MNIVNRSLPPSRRSLEHYFLETIADRLDPTLHDQQAQAARDQFTFYGAARQVFESQAPEVVISGAAGTGKSLACLHKLHCAAWQYPGMRALIVRKTRASLTESGLYTFEEVILGEDSSLLLGRMGTRLERATRRAYPYPNGSLIVVGGMDKSTRLLSTEYDLIFVQEAIELTESDWETLSTRLRHGQMPYQQLVADTNPDAPSHWIYQRSLLGELRMVSGSHEDNPLLYDPEQAVWTEIGQQYLSMLDKLTGPRYDRMRWGRWVQAEGAVYRDWNPAVHCVDHFPIPSDWRRFRVVDFGYTNPFVCLWIAQDHDGRVYVYRQLYHTERLVADHAKQINALSRLPNGQPERIEATICDHDAEDRATLERAGIRTKPATKDVRMGIQAVQERLRLAGDKKPRLVVLRDSLVERDHRLADVKRPCDLIEEFPGYVWGQPRGGDNPKEVPIKVDDHALDALRYGVMYVDQRAPRQLHVRQIRGLYRSADRQRAVKRGPRT